jgi:hypothetical protein
MNIFIRYEDEDIEVYMGVEFLTKYYSNPAIP